MSNITTIPTKTLKKIEAFIDEFRNKEEWLNEAQACELLGISKRTLQNHISKGNIKQYDISKGVGNHKFFRKKALIGLDKKVA